MKNLYIYLRFKFVDAFSGRHIGHTVKAKSMSKSASAKATSKYDCAEEKNQNIVNVFFENIGR